MGQFEAKTIFVTGATSGIGEACARAFAAEGARLLICGRRQSRLEALAKELNARQGTEVHAFVLDVRDRDAVEAAIQTLPAEYTAIDVLVNNAGLSRGLSPIHKGLRDDWDEMIDTNVKGLLYVSRAVIPGMVERGRGHVVNIGSIAGREVYSNGAVYCASKHAVDAITKGMRHDLLSSGIKVSTVDPGMVRTEFSEVRFHGDRERAEQVYRGMTPLTGADVAEAVLWVASRPAHVNAASMVLFASAQSAATQVHRQD